MSILNIELDLHLLQRRWVRVILYLGFWTSLGLFNVGQSYLLLASLDRPFNLTNALILGLADWYIWAGLALVIFKLARRFPFEHGTWPYSLIVHAVVCLVFTTTTVAVCVPIYQRCSLAWWSQATYFESFKFLLAREVVFYYWIYFAILGVYYARDYYRKYRERELRTSQLEARLAQAQLQVLRMQLHPHFLFNTLNAISSLIHRDLELADTMIAQLGELLRKTLDADGSQEVSLRKELEFIEPYLEIEKARLGPRLRVEMDIDPEVLDAQVPNLILQPIVENAIRHGIAVRREPGRLTIRAKPSDSWLELTVEDDGPGLPDQSAGGWQEGIGVANTRARLRQLYGGNHRFTMVNGKAGGLGVAMIIPLRTEQRPEQIKAVAGSISSTSHRPALQGAEM